MSQHSIALDTNAYGWMKESVWDGRTKKQSNVKVTQDGKHKNRFLKGLGPFQKGQTCTDPNSQELAPGKEGWACPFVLWQQVPVASPGTSIQGCCPS